MLIVTVPLTSSFSLLYYTSVILAHRPFWSVPAYYKVCISASQSIEKLVLLLESAFGLENITYMMGYCIYTGASAILEDARYHRGTADATLRTFLRALNSGMRRCPLLERSLNIVVKGLNSDMEPDSSVLNHQGQPDVSSLGSINYIPAFPYLDQPAGFEIDAHLGGMGMDSMSMLDCYPEMQLDHMDMGDILY